MSGSGEPSRPGSDTGAPNPIVAETERRLAAGQFVEAVTFAYLNAVQDVIRAFGLRPPRQWTHREFLTWGIRPDMGYFTSLLPRLYALYEPVRYGEERDWRHDDVVTLLKLLYAEEPMARLYSIYPPLGATWKPPTSSPPPPGPEFP